MGDARETAANIFDRTSKLAAGLAERSPGDAGLALGIAAGISKAIAAIIRAVGIEDAGKLVDELARDKNAGVITDAELAKDNAEIASVVSGLYNDGTPREEAFELKLKRSCKRTKKTDDG